MYNGASQFAMHLGLQIFHLMHAISENSVQKWLDNSTEHRKPFLQKFLSRGDLRDMKG